MAKPNDKSEATANVEKQLEQETGSDFVQTGNNPPTLAETDKPAGNFAFVETEEMPDKALHGKSDETFIVNEDSKQMTVIYSRPGYAKRPIPAGWREATTEELAQGKKAK